MRWLIGFALLRLTAADVAHRRRAEDRPALTGRVTLAGVQLTESGPQVVRSLPVSGRVVDNLAVADVSGEGLALAVSTDDGRLRLWRSQAGGV